MILSTIVLCLLDQALKFLAQLYWHTPLVLIPGLLTLRYAENTGIAWSVPLPQFLIVVVNILLLLLLPAFLVKKLNMEAKVSKIIISFFVAGALGNITDRIFRGYVIDYLAVGTFPVFNLADALITASVFLLLLFYDKIERKVD